jgi:hypothetical protein
VKATFISIAVAVTLLVTSPNAVAEKPSELKKKAHAVRATTAEMNFKRIPWVTDVFEGFKLARDEKRPVFLYMITGDPLDDC